MFKDGKKHLAKWIECWERDVTCNDINSSLPLVLTEFVVFVDWPSGFASCCKTSEGTCYSYDGLSSFACF